jgi:ABC-type bacteriocin/lantibiotic exporter with double-glycine peptidase domain
MPLLSLPLVRQSADHDCGLAVFRAVAEYWQVGSRRPPYPSPLNGTHPDNLEPAFQGAGFAVVSGNMTVPALAAMARLGWPVCCLIKQDGVGHWVVSRGVQRGRVYVMDPGDGKNRSYPESEFVSRWHDSYRRANVFERYGLAVWL